MGGGRKGSEAPRWNRRGLVVVELLTILAIVALAVALVIGFVRDAR